MNLRKDLEHLIWLAEKSDSLCFVYFLKNWPRRNIEFDYNATSTTQNNKTGNFKVLNKQ